MQMQFPAPFSESQHPSMFEAILEEYSMKMIDVEESNHEELPVTPQQEQSINKRGQLWIHMDEPMYQSILEEQMDMPQNSNLELHRVKSLRQQQQTKIALFLKNDKYKSLRPGELKSKNESPLGKTAKSLSPKKTKRIDKPRQFRLIHQSD